RLQTEYRERLEVERRLWLRALRVAVRRDDRVPAVHTVEPLEVARDPLARAARDDRGRQAAPLRFGQIVLDARTQVLEVAELVLACAQPPGHRLAVERPADELLEMRVGIEGGADRPHERRPLVDRQFVPVLAVQLLVREA